MEKRKLNRQILLNSFGNKCALCGYDRYPGALEFHHRNPAKKKIEISKFARNNNLTYDQIRELEGCVLLCSNCHRESEGGMHEDELGAIDPVELMEEYL